VLCVCWVCGGGGLRPYGVTTLKAGFLRWRRGHARGAGPGCGLKWEVGACVWLLIHKLCASSRQLSEVGVVGF